MSQVTRKQDATTDEHSSHPNGRPLDIEITDEMIDAALQRWYGTPISFINAAAHPLVRGNMRDTLEAAFRAAGPSEQLAVTRWS